MISERKFLVWVVIGSILLLVAGVFFLGRSDGNTTQTVSSEVVEIDYSKGQKIGSDSAKVKLVEFADLQCPACASAEPAVQAILAANLADFQYIYRHYPLPQHRNARAAANFAEYAGENGKFFDASFKLYSNQSQWEDLSDPKEYFAGIATELGLNPDLAKEAISQSKYQAKINDDLNEGTRVGVNSTPTFYLNGRKLSVSNFGSLKTLVEEELAK